MSTSPTLPADFPAPIWQQVEALVAGAPSDPGGICAELMGWLEGRPVDDLDAVLDALREIGAYPVSIELLEEAFASDLPLDRLGRVAEDWIGSVLHGLGDRAGAITVAEHITPRALTLGPAFAGDLGHLLLQWDLIDAARPLIAFAARRMPGELALQFALGVVRKFEGDWPAAQAAFEAVVAHRAEERSAWWNLGIACVAQSDWAGARAAWTRVGLGMPPGAPDADYGAPGALTPVRLETAPGAPAPHEVVWGHRLGPARVRLAGLPRFPRDADYGAVVLIDGVPSGELSVPEPTPIFPALATLTPSEGQRFHLRGPLEHPSDRARARATAEALAAHGWPVADWTGLDGAVDRVALGLWLQPGRSPAEALAAVDTHRDGLTLLCPELREAAGQDASAERALLDLEGIA